MFLWEKLQPIMPLYNYKNAVVVVFQQSDTSK